MPQPATLAIGSPYPAGWNICGAQVARINGHYGIVISRPSFAPVESSVGLIEFLRGVDVVFRGLEFDIPRAEPDTHSFPHVLPPGMVLAGVDRGTRFSHEARRIDESPEVI